MNPIIKPNVLNILCSDPSPVRKNRFETQPQSQSQPKQKLKEFWNKFGGLIKKVFKATVSVLTILPPILNAVSRFKDTFKSDDKKHDNG